MRPAGRSNRVADVAFAVVFGLYLAGLVFWLAIGVIPSLASALPSLRSSLLQVAEQHGFWAPFAARIIDHRTLLAHGPDVIVQYLFSLLNLALGLLLIARRWYDRVARLLAFALLGTAATFNEPSHQVFHVVGEPPAIKAIHFTFHIVSGVAYLWAVVLFPDDKLPFGTGSRSKWPVRALVAGVTGLVTVICWRSSFILHPPFFVVFFGILVSAAGVGAQTLRLRRPGSPEDHALSRLLRSALLPAMVTAVLWLLAAAATTLGGTLGTDALEWLRTLQGWFPAVFAVVPVALFIGILRYRLWQIDTIASRTLLYGFLAGFVTVAYVVIVTITGAVIGHDAWAAVVTMTAVGLAVEPVRHAMTGLANRLVYGQAMSPEEALRTLADDLERLGPAEELEALTRVVVTGTRAVASAAMWLVVDDHLLQVASWPPGRSDEPERRQVGAPAGEAGYVAACAADRCVPVRHQGRLLGLLALQLHAGVALAGEEMRLLDDLGDHAGLLVHNAQLTAELARHVEQLTRKAAELQRSRQRAATAQVAERRRLERNIHDGAQQELVALLVSLRMLGPLVQTDPTECGRELDELLVMVRSTHRTLAQLCGGGLPEVLVNEGIAAALEGGLGAARRAGLDVTVSAEIEGRAPLDVEAAAYFCCLEAVQNATKHARASTLRIALYLSGGELAFDVVDDGAGFDAAQLADSSGLANMAERIFALGGELSVESAPGAGTWVRGRVPVTAGDRELVGAPA